MVSCAACGFTQTSKTKDQGISFHQFPKGQRNESWTKFVQYSRYETDWTQKAKSCLCSRHFTDSCFDRTSQLNVRLWPTAIPTIVVDRVKYQRCEEEEIARPTQNLILTPEPGPSTSKEIEILPSVSGLDNNEDTREISDHAVNVQSASVSTNSTIGSQMLTNKCQFEGDRCYTTNTDKQVDEKTVNFGAKTKLDNFVVRTSNINKSSGKEMVQPLITSVKQKNRPLILKKVPSPFLNTNKYDAIPVDQAEVLNSLKGVGNVGDSPDNPIIFKLDIAKPLDIIKSATLHMKIVEQNDNSKKVVTKRKLDSGELKLEKPPIKVLKLGSQSGIQIIKTVPNQNVSAKVIQVVKCATSQFPKQNVNLVQKSNKATTLGNQAKKLQTNSNVPEGVLASTVLNKKVDSSSSILKERSLLKPKKVDSLLALNPTVIDLADQTSTSPNAIQSSPLKVCTDLKTKVYSSASIDKERSLLKQKVNQTKELISKKNELEKVDPLLVLNPTVIDLTDQTLTSPNAIQSSALEACTDLNKKVDSSSSIIKERSLLKPKGKQTKELTSKKSELNEVDPPLALNPTAIDFEETSDSNPTSYKCLVPDCLGTKFFSVPKIPKVVLIWQICLLNTGKKRPSNPISFESGKVLCDRHFIIEDFEEIPEDGKVGVLKKHAVPSLHPVCNGCIIPGCVNQHRNTANMYSIPVWRKCTLWLEYLPHLEDYSHFKLLTYRVCEEHFEEVNDSNMFNLVLTRNLPTFERLENLRAKKLGVKPEDLCAFLLCCRLKPDSSASNTFVPFPADKDEATTWLKLAFRDLILMQNEYKVQNFLITSPGLCPEHHIYISQLTGTNKRKLTETGISNVIDQLPLLSKSIAQQIILKKVQPVKPTAKMRKSYMPIREYCAFRNCVTHIKYDTKVRKFRFPTSDSQLYNEWKEAAGIHDNVHTNLSNYFVCDKHFAPRQFNSNGKLKMESVPKAYRLYKDKNANDNNILWVRKLKLTRGQSTSETTSKDPTVTPTKNPQEENSKPPDATKLIEKEKTQIPDQPLHKSIAKCCVKNCEVNASNGKLLNFPSLNASSQRELFVKAVLNKPSVSLSELQMFNYCHICTRHFKPEYLGANNMYKSNAVPTLFLNHETDNTGISDQDTTVVWEKIEDENLSENQCHSRKMVLHENCIEFPSVKSRLKFGKDCPKLGINRFPFDIKQPFSCPNVNPGQELQLDAAFIIDDDDESEQNAISLLCSTIKLNDSRAKKLITRLSHITST